MDSWCHGIRVSLTQGPGLGVASHQRRKAARVHVTRTHGASESGGLAHLGQLSLHQREGGPRESGSGGAGALVCGRCQGRRRDRRPHAPQRDMQATDTVRPGGGATTPGPATGHTARHSATASGQLQRRRRRHQYTRRWQATLAALPQPAAIPASRANARRLGGSPGTRVLRRADGEEVRGVGKGGLLRRVRVAVKDSPARGRCQACSTAYCVSQYGMSRYVGCCSPSQYVGCMGTKRVLELLVHLFRVIVVTCIAESSVFGDGSL
jgi:hypothetical protein